MTLNPLLKADKYFTRFIEIILAVLFIVIFLMVLNQVFLRYLFSSSIIGTAEVFTMLFTYCSGLGAAVMIRRREHIKITFFINKLAVPIRKAIFTFNYLIIIVFHVVVFRESLIWLNNVKNFSSRITGISYAVERIIIPVYAAVVILYCLFNIVAVHFLPKEFDLETDSADLEVKVLLEEAEEADREFLERQKQEKS